MSGSKMVNKIFNSAISCMLKVAKEHIGEQAIVLANSVDGLRISPGGDVMILEDGYKIIDKLVAVYEEGLQGDVDFDVEVKMHVNRFPMKKS